jgi:hypothetical protein
MFIDPGRTGRFHTDRTTARLDLALATPYPIVFLAEIPPQGLPVLTMGHHGTFSESGWTGGTVVFQQAMAVGDVSPPIKFDGCSFRLTHLEDTNLHSVFDVTVAPPNT